MREAEITPTLISQIDTMFEVQASILRQVKRNQQRQNNQTGVKIEFFNRQQRVDRKDFTTERRKLVKPGTVDGNQNPMRNTSVSPRIHLRNTGLLPLSYSTVRVGQLVAVWLLAIACCATAATPPPLLPMPTELPNWNGSLHNSKCSWMNWKSDRGYTQCARMGANPH